MYAVRCVNVRKIYKQGDEDVIGLDGVSLEVKKGGFVCLRSPSGGGKTTLLNVAWTDRTAAKYWLQVKESTICLRVNWRIYGSTRSVSSFRPTI